MFSQVNMFKIKCPKLLVILRWSLQKGVWSPTSAEYTYWLKKACKRKCWLRPVDCNIDTSRVPIICKARGCSFFHSCVQLQHTNLLWQDNGCCFSAALRYSTARQQHFFDLYIITGWLWFAKPGDIPSFTIAFSSNVLICYVVFLLYWDIQLCLLEAYLWSLCHCFVTS